MPRILLPTFLVMGLLVALEFSQLSSTHAVSRDVASADSLRIEWRRTLHGWEQIPVGVAAPVVALDGLSATHPLVLAALELLISLGGLVAFASEEEILRRDLKALSQSRSST